MSIVESIEQIVGYQFQNEQLLEEALTHASKADHRLQSNERMEFLGDAILGYVISEHLFNTFPQYEEGDLTKIKSAVVSRRVCAEVSTKIGLSDMLVLGKGMHQRSDLPQSIAAAVLESIIAAIYMDGGMDAARTFIVTHMSDFVEQIDATAHQHNFKSVLQQYAQKAMPANPQYILLDEKGPDHSKCFEVCVEIDGQRFGSSWANAKKEAEQKAALQALQELNLATVDEDDHVHLVDELTGKKKKSR